MALDVSTTTIGIAIIDYEEDGYNVLSVKGYWYRPNNTKKKWHELDPVTQLQLIEKAQGEIYSAAYMNVIDEFVIEDYVRFMGGGSTAKTIIPLAVLNTFLRMTIWKLGIEPQPLSVMKIRHALKQTKKLPTKEEIPNLLDKILGRKTHKWEYKMTDNNIKVGLTSWNEKNQTGPREPREELPRINFLRLKDGNNVVRWEGLELVVSVPRNVKVRLLSRSRKPSLVVIKRFFIHVT